MSREIKFKDENCLNEAVLAYREQFNLMPNRGFRADIAVTIKTYDDLCVWQDLVAHWGFIDKKTGKWVKRNPLDVKNMLTCFEFKQREKERERQMEASKTQRSDVPNGRNQGVPEWLSRAVPKLLD